MKSKSTKKGWLQNRKKLAESKVKNITPEERNIINKKFQALEGEKKNHFYYKQIKRYSAIRKRTKKQKGYYLYVRTYMV